MLLVSCQQIVVEAILQIRNQVNCDRKFKSLSKGLRNGVDLAVFNKKVKVFQDQRIFPHQSSKDILNCILVLLMRIVAVGLLLLVVLAIQANSLQTHEQTKLPILQGSKFQIRAGPFANPNVIFTFKNGEISWKQCNQYSCKFSQRGYLVQFGRCFNFKIHCPDKTESSLAKAIGVLGSFKVLNDKNYAFTNNQGKVSIVFDKI